MEHLGSFRHKATYWSTDNVVVTVQSALLSASANCSQIHCGSESAYEGAHLLPLLAVRILELFLCGLVIQSPWTRRAHAAMLENKHTGWVVASRVCRRSLKNAVTEDACAIFEGGAWLWPAH